MIAVQDGLYDYTKWPNFTKEELVCRHTGKENPNVKAFTALMDLVQQLRWEFEIPFFVNSAYRSEEHPIEALKISNGKRGGMHTYAAIDIRVPVEYCYRIVQRAIELGFKGIGINLKGDHLGRFIHLDLRDTEQGSIWSY